MVYAEDDWDWGRPLLATAIGLAAILALVFGALPLLPAAPLAIVLAGAFLTATAIWGLVYRFAMQRAGPYAKLFSYLLIVAAGIAASVHVATQLGEERLKADLRTLIELELDSNGLPRFPAGAERRGPISRLYVAFGRELLVGQHALDMEAEMTGVRLLADASALQADPRILADCSKFEAVKASAHAMFERRRNRFKALVVGLQETDYPEVFKRGLVAGVAGEQTDTELVQMDALQARILDAAQGACTILARRHWAPQGPLFLFSDEGDLEAFSAFGQQQNQANAELQRLQAASRARMRDGQTRMRRAVGDGLR